MATTFTNAISNNVGTTEVISFTASEKSIVIGGSITNKTTSTVPFTLILRRGSTDSYIQKDRRITAAEPFELMKGNKLVLSTGDKLVVSAKVANSVDAVFSILQGVS
jgi:hypothetical protein